MKRIFLRSSGTLNASIMELSKALRPFRRPLRSSLSRKRETLSTFTVRALVMSPSPRTFTRASACLMMPLAFRLSPSTTSPASNFSSRRLTLTGRYSTRLRFLKPGSFGRRIARGVWPPSKRGPLPPPARDFWPFMPRPAVLPVPEAGPRPTRLRFLVAPAAGEILQFHVLQLLFRRPRASPPVLATRRQQTSFYTHDWHRLADSANRVF